MNIDFLLALSFSIGLFAVLVSVIALLTNQTMRDMMVGTLMAVDNIRKTRLTTRLTVQATQEVLAKFQILVAREELVGQFIDLSRSKTTIGRDPRLTDIQLYNSYDETTVSNLHCTIQYDDNSNVFLLTDHSANGTRINGELITPEVPQILKDRDEIILGDPFYKGAKLRFEIVGQPLLSTHFSRYTTDDERTRISIEDENEDASWLKKLE